MDDEGNICFCSTILGLAELEMDIEKNLYMIKTN